MYISVLSWSRGWLRLQLEAYFKVKLINHLNILSEVFIFLNRTRRGQSTWKKLWQRHTCFTFRPGYHIFEHHKNLFSPPFLRPLAILVDLDCASWASISFWFWLKCAYILGSAAHLGCTESMQSQCRLSRQLECVYWPIWKQFTWQAFIKLTIALTQGSVLCCVLVDILLGRNMQFWQPLTEQQWSWPKPYLPTQAIFWTAAIAVQTPSWALPLLNR